MLSAPIRRRVRGDLLSGIAFVLPLALLVIVCYGVGRTILGVVLWFDGLLELAGIEGAVATTLAVGGVLIGLPTGLVLTGSVLRHRYGEAVADLLDQLLVRIPALGPMYQELRRSRQLLLGDSNPFREVVAIELANGVEALAFVVGRNETADWSPAQEERLTVYVPLSPNPTVGGHLLAVRSDRLRETELTVASALVTVGTNSPDEADPPIAGAYSAPPSHTR